MLIDHLRYLLVLEQTGSINKASALLHTSPQNISRILTQMEDELNMNLFIRTKSGISFTKKGEEFLAFARTTLLRFDCFLQSTSTAENIIGEITVYSSNLLTELYLNDLIIKFHEFYPNIVIKNIETDMLTGYQNIQNDPESFGMLCYFEGIQIPPDVIPSIFGSSTIIALVSKNSPLATHNEVSIQALLEEKILLFAQESVTMTESAILLPQLFTENTKLTITSNLTAYYKFVALDNYVSFVTQKGFNKQQNIYKADVSPLIIRELKNTPVYFSVLTNQNANYSLPQQKWLSFVNSYFQLNQA